MRTTLTLEPDIADRLRAEATLGKRSFKQIVNGALRRGLGMEEAVTMTPFRVIPHSTAFHPGVDPGKLNQLVDELEAAEFHHQRARP
jgi:hypothetical protein